MKRTPLKRKTPLKSKNGFSGPVKKSLVSQSTLKPKSQLNKRSLAGTGKTTADIEYHNKVISLGCFACNYLNLEPTTRLCLHHIDGRNTGKKGDYSERKVMCLCNLHHDPSTVCGASTKGISVHHNKKAFIETIGTEFWCVYETHKMCGETPLWITESDWEVYLSLDSRLEQEEWILAVG